jgi:hypothetical protein
MTTSHNILNFVEAASTEAQKSRLPAPAIRHVMKHVAGMLCVAAGPASSPNWGERRLAPNEVDALSALIAYQANNTRLSEYFVHYTVTRFFGIEELGQLKAWNYDAAVRYLVDFPAEDGAKRQAAA